MIITLLLSLLLLLNEINAEVISPDCNYAATSSHFYPIGGCERIKTVSDTETIYSAFKYVCYDKNEVYKLEYNGNDYCDGNVIKSRKISNDLQGFECDSTICGFADGCSTTGCIVNGSCSQCIINTNEYSQHCLPFITDHCHGNIGELLKYDTCSRDILTENFYYGADCNDVNKIFDIKSGGSDVSTNCYDNAYYTTSCNIRSLTPNNNIYNDKNGGKGTEGMNGGKGSKGNGGTEGAKSSEIASGPAVELIGDKYDNDINNNNNIDNNNTIYNDQNGGKGTEGMNGGKGSKGNGGKEGTKSSDIASGPAVVLIGDKYDNDINNNNDNNNIDNNIDNNNNYVIYGYSLSFNDLCLLAILGLAIICFLYKCYKHKVCRHENYEHKRIGGYHDDESKSLF